MRPTLALLQAALLAALLGACTAANPVLVFNSQAQGRVRESGVQNQLSSKVYALTHIAQLLAIDQGASEAVQAAQAAYAGHTVLNLLFPWAFSKHDAALKNFTLPLTPEENAAAEEASRQAGLAVVASRLDDGFDRWVPFTPAPTNGPVGEYQFVSNQTYALYPQLATTRTIVLPANQTFGLAAHTIPSEAYTADLAEVFSVGAKNSSARTADQTQTVYFWLDNNTTSSISGHWNQIAQAVLPANASLYDAALLFSRLNAAIWDASIAGWQVKYTDLFWRPVTAIRQGDGEASNAAYVSATWAPELSTPSHPEYPSGHSISSGAAAGVLANYFGSDEVTFTIGTEYPGLEPRTYTSFQEAVDEVGESRVLGGVHFRKAVVDGGDLGRKVADYIYDLLTPAALTAQA